MDRTTFESAMELPLAFYEVTMSRKQFNVWFECFKDISLEAFTKAWEWHFKHDQINYFPPPGKITTALDQIEEARINKKQERPIFTTLWVRVVSYFPGKQDYPHFPPEEDEEAWGGIYDRIHAVPMRDRAEVVAQIIQELESK